MSGKREFSTTRILKYTLAIEGAGALLVMPWFVRDFGLRGCQGS